MAAPRNNKDRRYRDRQSRGVRVYKVELPDEALEAFIEAGYISEAEAVDREKVGLLLADFICGMAKEAKRAA